MSNFAITGVAGYVAPRHLKAIQDTGQRLVAAMDPHDSVGILDQFPYEIAFFTEFERFDRHLEMLRRQSERFHVNYVSICAPNHLHDAHIRLALRIGAHVLCEKPLVLNPWNLDSLIQLERESGKRVFTVLQLRVHPSLIKLKDEMVAGLNSRKHEVTLTYVTSRGPWYHYSWKGSLEKSGGIATNIGIHFFDLLIWIFGPVEFSEVHLNSKSQAAGYLELASARVKWFLSIDKGDLPEGFLKEGKRTYRSISVDEREVEFSEGFTDLHSEVYRRTLNGEGFGIEDARESIELVHNIRIAGLTSDTDKQHEYLKRE